MKRQQFSVGPHRLRRRAELLGQLIHPISVVTWRTLLLHLYLERLAAQSSVLERVLELAVCRRLVYEDLVRQRVLWLPEEGVCRPLQLAKSLLEVPRRLVRLSFRQ